MPRVVRKSDAIENLWADALPMFLGGVPMILLGALLWKFKGDGMFVGLAAVLMLGGVGLIAWGFTKVRKVKEIGPGYMLECVFCSRQIELLEAPKNEDVTCPECHRLIPIKDGVPLPVHQVRCGFCNTLNYYSEKTEFLICEKCDREIPLTLDEEKEHRHAPKGYVVVDDNQAYQLVLREVPNPEHPPEDCIATLQTMLALNRNQVKQLLGDLPAVLLTGITRKKAELLEAQLTSVGMTAVHEPVSN